MSGEGAFGKVADAGLGGILPTILSERRRRKKEDGSEDDGKASRRMKKGGRVRGDGIAIRGKTKGRML